MYTAVYTTNFDSKKRSINRERWICLSEPLQCFLDSMPRKVSKEGLFNLLVTLLLLEIVIFLPPHIYRLKENGVRAVDHLSISIFFYLFLFIYV